MARKKTGILASDLIRKLQQLKRQHGNLPVKFYSSSENKWFSMSTHPHIVFSTETGKAAYLQIDEKGTYTFD